MRDLTKTRFAHVYLSPERPDAIVATLHFNRESGGYHSSRPIVVERGKDPTTLGTALKLAIDQYFDPEMDSSPKTKATDYPPCRVSGCRSLREFEGTFLEIRLEDVNEHRQGLYAYATPSGEDELCLKIQLLECEIAIEVGRKILRLFEACTRWDKLELPLR